jgi:hypothetical protein
MKQLTKFYKKLSIITKITVIGAIIFGILGIFLQSITPKTLPIVSKISPEFTIGINEDSNFTISLSEIVGINDQKNIKFNISPSVKYNSYWLENNFQYQIDLIEPMKNNTEYTISASYNDKQFFSHTFITTEFTEIERIEQMRIQGLEDQRFSNAQIQQEKDFPWISDIPIVNDNFVIVYNYELEKFRIRLKDSKDINEQLKINLINEALKIMKSKGIDPDKWGYYVK